VDIKPNYRDSVAVRQGEALPQRPTPTSIPMTEQMATEMRELDGQKGINLAVSANDALRTVLEDMSHIRVYANKVAAGKLKNADRTVMQKRIEGIKAGIKESLQNTEFNKVRNVQTNPPEDQGRPMKIENTSLETLGIDKFDVTGEFDVADIDEAIKVVKEVLEKDNDQKETTLKENTEENIKFNEISRDSTLSKPEEESGGAAESLMILKKTLMQQQINQQMQQQTQRLDGNKENELSLLI